MPLGWWVALGELGRCRWSQDLAVPHQVARREQLLRLVLFAELSLHVAKVFIFVTHALLGCLVLGE